MKWIVRCKVCTTSFQEQVSFLLAIPEELKWCHWGIGKLQQNPCSLLLLKISGRDYEEAQGRLCLLYERIPLPEGNSFVHVTLFPTVGNDKSRSDFGAWMQAFYTAPPAESNWQKQSWSVFPVKNFHGCSQSMDGPMALQHEIIAPLPTNPTYYLLVHTVSERRNNLAQCWRSKIDFWIAIG